MKKEKVPVSGELQPIASECLTMAALAAPLARKDQVLKRSVLVPVMAMAFLAVSWWFLASLQDDPAMAVRGDDYWAMSTWFSSFGPFPYTHFGPGYPFLIHLLRSIGVTMFGLLILQKAMVAALGYAIYRIGRLLGLPVAVAAAAGFAFTIFPIVQATSSLFFSETFYLLLIVFATWLFLDAKRLQGRALLLRLVLTFGLLGLAALVRGNALVLLASFALIGCFRFPLRAVILAAVIGGVPILGWSAMNYQWYGHFKPTSSGDANIAASLVGPVMADLEGKPRVAGPEVWIESGGRWQDHAPNLFEFSLAARKMAIAYAAQHPVAVVIGNVKGWFHSLLGPARADILQFFGPNAQWLVAVSLAVRAALLAGLLGFFAGGAWRRQTTFAAVLLCLLFAHVVPAGAAGYARFGFPIDAFSVLALALLVQYCRHRGQVPAA